LGGIRLSRLVIVSNRVVDLDNQVQSGGLAVALGDALRSIGGIWFGWDGNVVEQGKPIEVRRTVQNNVTIATIPMTERDYEEYYLGFSNKVLWPVYHCRLDLAQFEPAYFEGYKRVNKGFATALAPLLRADDMVWAHDYHLISFGAELRALGARQRLGFFLHIPFPPPELLQAIPAHNWLVEALFQFRRCRRPHLVDGHGIVGEAVDGAFGYSRSSLVATTNSHSLGWRSSAGDGACFMLPIAKPFPKPSAGSGFGLLGPRHKDRPLI
jgi:hypothetical protein